MVTVVTLALLWAQEADFRQVTNPFQDGYPYRLGDALAPNVDVEGMRWTLVRVAARTDREIVEDRDVPITVDLEFENRREEATDVLVILLLEDADGNGLERIQCDTVRAGAGRFKSSRQKFKVPGEALLKTEGLYLFCELQ